MIILPVKRETELPVPIEHQWHSINLDINSQNLEKRVLETAKYVCVKLEQLLGHTIQGCPSNLAKQFHLEEKQEEQHTRPDVEERTQDFKHPHHRPTICVKLGRGRI